MWHSTRTAPPTTHSVFPPFHRGVRSESPINVPQEVCAFSQNFALRKVIPKLIVPIILNFALEKTVSKTPAPVGGMQTHCTCFTGTAFLIGVSLLPFRGGIFTDTSTRVFLNCSGNLLEALVQSFSPRFSRPRGSSCLRASAPPEIYQQVQHVSSSSSPSSMLSSPSSRTSSDCVPAARGVTSMATAGD